MNLKKNIKKVLKEETNEFELVKNFIYTMYDNVRVVEYIAKRNEVMVYYTNHDNRQMLIPTEICELISNYTGLDVVPWYEYDKNRVGILEPDFYLDTEEYDEELNENYSPAGKEITPNKIVIHKSNPKFRDRISNEGLKASAGECYKIYAGYGEKCIPAIFATNSINKRAWFDSTYDDDVWSINTELIPNVKWYKDRHFESTKKHIVTFNDISSEAIELIHEGTGKDLMKESKQESKKEMIENVLNNIILPEYDHVICGFEVKEPNERFDTLHKSPFKFVSVTVTFIGGHGTKLFPQTQGVKVMYDEVLDEIWDVIYNYTNEAVDVFYKTTNDCGKKNIYLKESNNKNKTFLKYKFGIDFDGKIKMIQSFEELPSMFRVYFFPKDFNRMLNNGGPFYVINSDKGYKIGNKYVNKYYLYRPRVDGSSYLIDQDGYNKAESTFLENLGIDIIGLTIKDLIDMYFEESINESEDSYII